MATKRERDRRAERRAAQRKQARVRDSGDGPTLGEVVAERELATKTSWATRRIIAGADEFVRNSARVQLSVVACDTCAVAKACCTLRTRAWLFEGLPIAARLRREGRDTPALREELRTAARLMDAPGQYRRRCAFLDPADRCSVYDDRPTVCGTTYVSSDPAQCGVEGGTVKKYLHPFGEAAATAQAAFEQELGLAPVPGGYLRTLPRVVLLCLEAWDRRDHVAFLQERLTATARRDAPSEG